MKMVSTRLKILTLKVYIAVLQGNGADVDETWMHGDWFYTEDYVIFGHEDHRKVFNRQSYTIDHHTV